MWTQIRIQCQNAANKLLLCVQLTANNAARAGVLSCHALMASMHSLLVGSARHNHISASAMLSLVVCILLNLRGVIMLRTTCKYDIVLTMSVCIGLAAFVPGHTSGSTYNCMEYCLQLGVLV